MADPQQSSGERGRGEGVSKDDLGICTMCEEAPATTTWGFPVCQPCADGLDATQSDLKEMEAEDPHLAALGRRVEASAARFFAERADLDRERDEGDLNGSMDRGEGMP